MDYRSAKKLNIGDVIERKTDHEILTIQEVIPWKTLHQKKVVILKCIDKNGNEINLTHVDVVLEEKL